MKITQELSTGVMVRQDFRDSVRFVMFSTGLAEWEYATHGGTIFIVDFRGKLYGLTCFHVFGDFNWRQLAITESKFGRQLAGLKTCHYPSDARKDAIGTDIVDIVVIEFADDIGGRFFGDTLYIIDANTIGTSADGDELLVNGNLKEKSDLGSPTIKPEFDLLEFLDGGATSADPTLRNAYALFDNPEFNSITGVSGAPVFNVTQEKLCGMAVRGGLTGAHCTLWYVDMSDILQVLTAVFEERTESEYEKIVRRRLPE